MFTMSLTRFSRTFATSTRVLAENQKGMLEKAGETLKEAAQAFKVSLTFKDMPGALPGWM